VLDKTTKNPFRVKSDRIAGSFLMLPITQLASVCRLLRRNSIQYWVHTLAILLDDRTAKIVVNFGRTAPNTSVDLTQLATLPEGVIAGFLASRLRVSLGRSETSQVGEVIRIAKHLHE
jgi:hypothetical protein